MPPIRYREHAPSPLLRPYVACYWSLRADREAHRVLPDGCMDLLFDLRDARVDVIGAMTRPIVTDGAPGSRLMGVRFRPGEAFAFVGVAARETRDAVVPLRDAWGSVASEIAERVLAARDDGERVRLLDAELLARRRRAADARVRRAVVAIEAARGAVRVAALARGLGVGERQLERLFDERVGIGPKVLARVARVQELLALLDAGGATWGDLAARLGYADQSHLARDVRKVADLTPAELARTRMSDSSNPSLGPLATTFSP